MEAMITGRGYEEAAVNIPNAGLLRKLPDWLLVEVPANVGSGGLLGISVDLPGGVLGLLFNQIGIHDLTASAVLEKSRDPVIQALLVDPVTTGASRIPALVDHMIAEQGPWLDYLRWRDGRPGGRRMTEASSFGGKTYSLTMKGVSNQCSMRFGSFPIQSITANRPEPESGVRTPCQVLRRMFTPRPSPITVALGGPGLPPSSGATTTRNDECSIGMKACEPNGWRSMSSIRCGNCLNLARKRLTPALPPDPKSSRARSG